MTPDEAWRDYERLAWKAAIRASRIFGGRAEDYIGSVYVKLAIAAKYWQPDHGTKFSSFFMRGYLACVDQWFARYESERNSLGYYKRNRKDVEHLQQIQYFNAYETDSIFWRPPQRDDWCTDILKLFDTPQDLWAYLTRWLSFRDKMVLERIYRYGHTLREIAEDIGVTRQRVEQIAARAISRLGERIGPLERWADLFRKEDIP